MELDIFMEKHGRDILSFCKYLTKNTDEAEDLCQDTFLLGIEKAEQYEDDSHAKNYMLSIAVRLWKNRKRKYAWRRRIMDEQIIPKSEYEQENTGEINSPEAVVIKNEEHAFVRECVGRLPEKKRMVILLYYMEGLKEKEIADVLNISQGTVKSRLHKARAELAAMLSMK
jgi:RNA polymerase sigma-70 factor (ECF subfamily)